MIKMNPGKIFVNVVSFLDNSRILIFMMKACKIDWISIKKYKPFIKNSYDQFNCTNLNENEEVYVVS